MRLGCTGSRDVEEDANPRAGAGGQAEIGVCGDIVAAADVGRGSAFAVHVADVQTVHRSGGLIGEDARAVDDLGQLRVCERDLDHDDGVQRGVGIVDAAAGAAG